MEITLSEKRTGAFQEVVPLTRLLDQDQDTQSEASWSQQLTPSLHSGWAAVLGLPNASKMQTLVPRVLEHLDPLT